MCPGSCKPGGLAGFGAGLGVRDRKDLSRGCLPSHEAEGACLRLVVICSGPWKRILTDVAKGGWYCFEERIGRDCEVRMEQAPENTYPPGHVPRHAWTSQTLWP